MLNKQSNNVIEGINTFCIGEKGENYCFPGACEQLMKCLGEQDLTYWMIAGITGDCCAQVYPKNNVFYSDRYCVSDYHILYDDDCSDYITSIFAKMGYAATYVPIEQIKANPEMYRRAAMAYIDKGVPVIYFKGNYTLICGYEEDGRTLIHRTPCDGNNTSFELNDNYFSDPELRGWIFVGEKICDIKLADILRDAVKNTANIMTTETDKYYFGAAAFRAWADDIEGGFYDGKRQEEVDLWGTYTSFICNLATNGGGCQGFFDKALELNTELAFIAQIKELFWRFDKMWKNDNGTDLEALGGGFNVTLEALQDKEKRAKIAAKIREFAVCADEIVKIIKEGIKA
jgi:hypothetical protein